jgi:tetratricopeptide (TPR) repeat protein
MDEEVKKIEAEVKKEWPALISGVGGITALIGLFVTLGGGVTWLVNHHRQAEERKARLALAQTEAEQGDYEASIKAYDELLKSDPGYRPALDGELRTAEQWVENFEVSAPEGEDPAPMAAAKLDEIMPVLDAGLGRAKGAQAADIQAHLGWAHWLNQKIAEREFGAAAENDMQAALKLDAKNVYANAMLGNWMLETNGDFSQAMQHFDVAASTSRERPLVRAFELGALQYLERKGARAAQVRVANDMRKGGEPLDEDSKRRIVSFCFDPGVNEPDELKESLTAVAPDEEWKTYLWLDDGPESDSHRPVRAFIQANLLELSGNAKGALAQYQALQQELKDAPGSLRDQVDAAVARLQRG